MKLLCFAFFFLIALFNDCRAQEKTTSVISAAGGIAHSNTLSLEWTLGEPVSETAISSSRMYTQGFHQPMLQIKKLDTPKEISSVFNSILVYPNPSASLVTIQPNK